MLKVKIDHPGLYGEILTKKNAPAASQGEEGNAFIEIQDHDDSCKIPCLRKTPIKEWSFRQKTS